MNPQSLPLSLLSTWRPFRLIAAAFLALLFLNPLAAQDSGEPVLAWKFKQGDEFRVELTQTETSDTSVDTRNTRVESMLTLVFDWQVVEVDDQGVARIEQAIKRIAADVANPAIPTQAVVYDTAVAEKPSKLSKKLLKQVEPLIGLKFTLKVKPSGKIESVELPEETSEALDQLPGTIGLKALFNRDGLTEMLGASAIAFPEDNARRWERDWKMGSAFGTLTRRQVFSLRDSEQANPVQAIDVTISLDELTGGEPIRAPSPANKEVDRGELTSFTGKGTISFDRREGHVANSDVSYTIESRRDYREKKITTLINNQIEVEITRVK